jgi:hypothetical protein
MVEILCSRAQHLTQPTERTHVMVNESAAQRLHRLLVILSSGGRVSDSLLRQVEREAAQEALMARA